MSRSANTHALAFGERLAEQCSPSGETIAVMQPPLQPPCSRPVVPATSRTCSCVSQPVAFTTKQPDSSAWWRMVTSIWSAKIGPTSEPGNIAQWISSCWAISA